jgi:hypothetical protein
MRSCVVVLGILFAMGSIARADDTVLASTTAPPAAAQAVIDEVSRALDKDDAKALVAVAASKVKLVDGKKVARGKLTGLVKKAGDLHTWLGSIEGGAAWMMVIGDDSYELTEPHGAVIVVAKSGTKWRVTEIHVASPDGSGGLGLGGGCGGISSGYAPLGGCGGTGSGYGVGGGGCGGGGGHHAAVPSARLGQPTVSGPLDKAIVRRYLKRNITKLQYCYEKQLLVKPTLAGELAITFTIDDTGKVPSAISKGLDADVASCVTTVIEAIEYPKPKDGGTVSVAVKVRYKPTGG